MASPDMASPDMASPDMHIASPDMASPDMPSPDMHMASPDVASPDVASQVHASDQFEAGWLVVTAQWFQLLTTSPRCYKLQTVERTLVVNEMIRLSGLKFEKVQRASPRLGNSFYSCTFSVRTRIT